MEECDAEAMVVNFITISLNSISCASLFPNMSADEGHRCVELLCKTFLDVSTGARLKPENLGTVVACALSAFNNGFCLAYISLHVIPPCIALVQRLQTPFSGLAAEAIALQLGSDWAAVWEPQHVSEILDTLKMLPLSTNSQELILNKCVSSCCTARSSFEKVVNTICFGMLNFLEGDYPQTIEVSIRIYSKPANVSLLSH